MKNDTIIAVGSLSSKLLNTLDSTTFDIMQCTSLNSLPSVVDEFSLVIFSDNFIDDLTTISEEQLSFYTNKKPVAIFTTPANASINKISDRFELLYDFEADSKVIINRINTIVYNHKINENLIELMRQNYSEENLKKEISLRDRILSHEQHINSNILSSITSGLLILDLEGTVIVANNQVSDICLTKDLVGSSYKDLPSDAVDIVDSLLYEKDSSEKHSQMRKGSIGHIKIRITGYFIKNSGDRPIGLLLLLDDITEEENVNQLLYRSEKLATIGTMLSGIAHELRNPLSIISARTKIILMKKDFSEETILKGIGSIDKQAIRCANIVNSLLNLTRTKTASTGYHKIKELISETLSYIEYQNSFDNIEIINHYDKDYLVYGDRSRIVQILLNLISNAADAMDGNGTLTIKASIIDSKHTLIEINDTGTGIDPINENKLFDPFFTTKEPGKGTGLGLAIVFKIVSEINGSIWFKSIPNNTSFFVKLPSDKEAHSELPNTSRR